MLHRFQAAPIQFIVVMGAMPALSIVAVGDVELCASVTRGGVRACKRRAGFDKLITSKKRKAVRERLSVDRVRANARRHGTHCLGDRFWLGREQPSNETAVYDHNEHTGHADEPLAHL